MPYILKKGIEAFDVVDGPFAGKKYKLGVEYQEVPSQEAHKFVELKAQSTKLKAKEKPVVKAETKKPGAKEIIK